MFAQTLLPDTFRAVKLIAGLPDIKKAYLAGGTALALRVGHRISVDLDFFTTEDFDETVLAEKLKQTPEFKLGKTDWKTVIGVIGETKFSIFFYKYPIVEVFEEFEGIKIAGLQDLAAMKIHAVEDRGSKRDFVDVYFLAKKFSLEEMFDFYNQKYGVLDSHKYSIIKALGYFDAAETQEMPNMLIKTDWEEVKEFFDRETMRLGKKALDL